MFGRRRSVHRLGSVLALLALALQFVLSFDHFHPEDFFPSAAAEMQAGGSSAPERPDPVLPSHDDCAICLSMAMIGASALPPPVAATAPTLVAFFEFPQPLLAASRPAPRRSFRSRDPPSV